MRGKKTLIEPAVKCPTPPLRRLYRSTNSINSTDNALSHEVTGHRQPANTNPLAPRTTHDLNHLDPNLPYDGLCTIYLCSTDPTQEACPTSYGTDHTVQITVDISHPVTRAT